jgi:hypothetical protein
MSTEKRLSKADGRFNQRRLCFPSAKLLPWLFSAVLLAGCAHRYDMTLTNGTRVTNITKPILYRDEGAFYYKDVAGKVHHVSAGHVVEIKPHSSKNTTPGTIQ